MLMIVWIFLVVVLDNTNLCHILVTLYLAHMLVLIPSCEVCKVSVSSSPLSSVDVGVSLLLYTFSHSHLRDESVEGFSMGI